MKTGDVLRVRVSYGEGLAAHTGLESCACGRKGVGEALARERVGRVLSREIELCVQGAQAFHLAEGNMRRSALARHGSTLRGLRPRACTEARYAGIGRSRTWPRQMVARSAL